METQFKILTFVCLMYCVYAVNDIAPKQISDTTLALFKPTYNAVISDQNEIGRSLAVTSRTECADLCMDEAEFVCHSFEYSDKDKTCNLINSNNRPALITVDEMTDSEHWELSSFPECGQTITTEAAGLLASSRWQDNIASSTKWCKYTITNSQPDGHINLEFPYVRVHSAAGDRSDLSEEKVIIYDGPTSSSEVLGVYCLKTLPKSLISSSNTVAIEYLAPSQEVGFVIAYSMNFGEQVRYLQYPATGEVKSPGYPDNYLDSREYVWSFTAPSDQKVVLEFNDFDLEYGTDCDYDFVEVYDGVEMTSSNLIGRYCGQSLPDIIESTSKDLSMKFVSDHAVNSKGFSAFFHYEAEQTESSTEDPCQAEKDEINEVKAHRGALYITTIVFGSVGFVMIVMLSASIYLISGREVKLRHYAGVSLTDPFLTELEPKKKKKKAKSKASDSFEEETDGNEEGATGGSDDVTSDGKDNKGLDIEVKVE